ncbi:hypothetical protein MRY82_06895 [bacterium]|nr:hypothetical protein [bacterium]
MKPKQLQQGLNAGNINHQDTLIVDQVSNINHLDTTTITKKSPLNDDLIEHHDEEQKVYPDLNEKDLLKKHKVKDKSIEPIVYQWTSVVKSLELFKYLSLVVIVALLISSASIFYLVNKPFLAYDRKDQSVKELAALQMQPGDLKDFIQKFVKQRYTWAEFDPQKLVYNLRPMITKRFSKDLVAYLGKDKAKNKQGETIEQYVTRIKPIVTDTAAFAVFDRILRINDIPIIVPVQLRLNIIQGRKTRFNPFGFYVDKIMEFEK